MKRFGLQAVLLGVLGAVLATFSVAQSTGTVRGKVLDTQGAPLAGAEVTWKNNDNGRVYKLKTNKNGEYFSLGLDPGAYLVTLSKDGKVLDQENNVRVSVSELQHDIDLKQIQQQSGRAPAGNSPAGISPAGKSPTSGASGKAAANAEQIKQQQAEAAKAQQFNEVVKVVNEKLNAATAAAKATPPDYAQELQLCKDAAALAPGEDVVWYRLGWAYLDNGKVQTDATEKANMFNEAYNNLQKALDMKKAAMEKGSQGAPDAVKAQKDKHDLAVYYDNLGGAAARVGKNDEAITDYEQAGQLDPANVGTYNYNLAITLHNFAKDADGKKKAAEAFDKVIAADPNRADAYFLKGSDLIGLSTTDSAGKLVPPDGTVEALQKYIELQPTGTHAEEAKQMLAMLNAPIESSYGKKSASPKKK